MRQRHNLSFARLSGLMGVVLLLAACASQPPPRVAIPAPVEPAETQIPFAPGTDDVLFRALGLVGTPYRWGGNSPDGGFDCSGLIVFVFREVMGLRLPRTTGEMSALDVPTVPQHALEPGDLVFFATEGKGRVSHAGIYVGERRFVHAPRTGGTVRLDSLDNGYWRQTYLLAKRVLLAETLAAL